MTDTDIIKNAIDVLGAINVPVGLLNTIGAPIYQVRQNLQVLLKAVMEKEEEHPEEAVEEPAE